MTLLLRGQFAKREIFANLLSEFFPITFSISVNLELTCTFPVGVSENWFKVSEEIVMLLPFA